MGTVVREEPWRGVKVPMVERIRIQPLNTKEIAAVTTATDDRYRAQVVLVAGTGPPPGRGLWTQGAPSRPAASPSARGAVAHHDSAALRTWPPEDACQCPPGAAAGNVLDAGRSRGAL